MIFTRKVFVLIMLLLSVSFADYAQQYNFKNYTTKNGLVGSNINHIFQDSKGFIWFATSTGVSCFNGKSFKNYTTKDGLISNDVTYFAEDKKNQIWIATTAGVSRFDGSNFINYDTKRGLLEGAIRCVFVDANNKVWLAVNGGGINIIDGNKIDKITTKEGLPDKYMLSIIQDKQSNYWFAMEHGIVKYDGVHFGAYDTSLVWNHQLFISTLLDSKGNVWFGGDCVMRYDGANLNKFDLPPYISGMINVNQISEDSKGNIWFATENGALKFEDNQFKLFTQRQGLSLNFVLSIKTDYEGNIWIGTSGGGVSFFNNESFTNYTDKDGLSSNNVNCITSENNQYYIGTGTGVNILRPSSANKIRELSEINELSGVNINCIYSDDKGLIWVGVQDGVYVIEKKGEHHQLAKKYQKIGERNLESVLKIIQDKNGTYWIVTQSSGAFSISKDNEEKWYGVKTGFCSDNIMTVFEDRHSNIWFGTQDSGAIKIEGNNIKQFNQKNGFQSSSIFSIAEDDKGNLFFGTKENGLVCYNGKQFKSYTTVHGLVSDLINLLQWDNIDKCLWIGSGNGINKVKFKSNLAIYDIRTYSEQEGFKGIEVTQNSSVIDNEGLVWFGSINGLTCYNRKYDFPNTTPPKIYLSEIKVAYKKVDWNNYSNAIDANTNLPKNLELSYKNNHLTFYFQALTTDKVKYTFMLEGQDKDWSPLSENTEADYSNISPGKTYTFKVKAINSNGKWSSTTTNFTFTIHSPWYSTWWAYLIYFVATISSAIFIFKWRTASLKQQQKILEATVIERTVELDNSNKKLTHAFQEIKDSISYAKTIQQAILPLDEDIKNSLPDSFVLFKPRDVVSGDFYWFYAKENKIYFAAVDCTGHGVPGAFMSMIGYSLLNEIVSTDAANDAAGILNKLHDGVRKSLKQNRDVFESKDGMDMALTVIDSDTNMLQYAGAKRPLLIARALAPELVEGSISTASTSSELIETKADKQSIGGLEIEHDFSFTNHNFELKKGDTFYMFTDGYIDQFGGEKDKKYSTVRLKNTLQELQPLSLKEQGKKLDSIINQWKINTEQTDDILVIGFRIK